MAFWVYVDSSKFYSSGKWKYLGESEVTEPLAIWPLILQASLFVKLIMLLLLLSSFLSWALIIERWLFYRRIEEHLKSFEADFWGRSQLEPYYTQLKSRSNLGALEEIFVAGYKAFQHLKASSHLPPQTIIEATNTAMQVIQTREEELLTKRLSFLASVGSIAPYVGLLGTVWGVMDAFRHIASLNQVSLAQVAPGIAEALIATAMGLFVAIPAVVSYNRFVVQVDRLMARMNSFSSELSHVLYLHL